jgi:LmbE family N-acetylglucosaminyl deacetylase
MWLKIENEQLLSIFKVGTMDKNTGFFYGLNWNLLNCSIANSNSEIVKLIRERNPDLFIPYEKDKVYPGINWKAE